MEQKRRKLGLLDGFTIALWFLCTEAYEEEEEEEEEQWQAI